MHIILTKMFTIQISLANTGHTYGQVPGQYAFEYVGLSNGSVLVVAAQPNNSAIATTILSSSMLLKGTGTKLNVSGSVLLNVSGDICVENGSSIDATGSGYAKGKGVALGFATGVWGGGAHGGRGG